MVSNWSLVVVWLSGCIYIVVACLLSILCTLYMIVYDCLQEVEVTGSDEGAGNYSVIRLVN
jgi:hypothetical protein